MEIVYVLSIEVQIHTCNTCTYQVYKLFINAHVQLGLRQIYVCIFTLQAGRHSVGKGGSAHTAPSTAVLPRGK